MQTSTRQNQENQPNIVFIFSDQHNHAVMGAAGDPVVRTPHLDQFARRSVRFTNCYCSSPLCVPSRSSLMTGLMPLDCGVMNNFQSIYPDLATLAHTINNAGYETVLSGRMHFVGPDQFHGYEQHLVGDCTPHFHSDDHFQDLYGDYVETFKQKRETLERSGAGYTTIQAFDRDVVAATGDFLANRTDSRPLFMTVGFIAPHPPFIVEQDLFDYYDERVEDITTSPAFREHLHPAMRTWLEKRKITDVSDATKHRVRAAYYGLVEFLDSCVGEVLKQVEETIGLENTMIVYASDHGECMGVNDLYWKTTFYEDSVKVPLMISYPEWFKKGIVVDEPMSLLDLGVTFTEVAGARRLPGMCGMSLVPVCTEGRDSAMIDRPIMSQIGNYPPAKDKPSAMIRKGRWKLISYYGYEYPSLFDLEQDPLEVYDLGQDVRYTEIREELQAELFKTWDPERAFQYCNRSNEHFEILKYWAEHTKHQFDSVWEPPADCNYLSNE